MPRKLTNLYQLYETESLSAITAMHVGDLTGEGTPQIYTLCGRGPRSTLRVLRHGLGVSEMASSQLPGKPSAVWTVKSGYSDIEEVYDKYIVISFLNATLVLGVGTTVTEVTNSGFDTQKPTIHVGLLATSAIIQVIHTGIRHICPDGRVETWEAPGKISKATSNERQVVISLQGGILIYFELDGTGNLRQVQKKEMEQEVTCMNIASIPEGRIRARFLAVGCYDNTIKILSLDPEGCLGRLSTQALPASQAESVCLIEMGHSAEDKELYLNVGLGNGVMLRTVVDSITGQLSDTRARYLGSRGVRLHKVKVQGTPALAALSSRPWLCYNYMSRHLVTPLSYETLEYMSSFSSEMCIEGMVAISANTLRIFVLEQLGELFNQTVLPLTYTPRKLEINPQNNHLYILESDHNSFTIQERQRIKQALKIEDDLENELTEAKIGVPQAGTGRWASCIRIVDPIKVISIYERI